MTEAEWLASNDPARMLESLIGDASQRKLRLFAVGCYRLIWDVLKQSLVPAPDAPIRKMRTSEQIAHDIDRVTENSYRSFEIAENHADGKDTGGGLKFITEYAYTPVARLGYADAVHAARAAESDVRDYLTYNKLPPRRHEDLLRDIFGNPFHPVAFDPAWLTSDVLALARGIYDERAFDRMPILADALQDAGCDNDDILSHCRGPGPHVRGCWVVDLVLGKE